MDGATSALMKPRNATRKRERLKGTWYVDHDCGTGAMSGPARGQMQQVERIYMTSRQIFDLWNKWHSGRLNSFRMSLVDPFENFSHELRTSEKFYDLDKYSSIRSSIFFLRGNH
mmetsp:Transcript_12466/g.31488  ORF Transcript_12466/g.31488 Transcript_12466/m.31488 type:complete len:114 (-) Transcript_12466:968-1309(-)